MESIMFYIDYLKTAIKEHPIISLCLIVMLLITKDIIIWILWLIVIYIIFNIIMHHREGMTNNEQNNKTNIPNIDEIPNVKDDVKEMDKSGYDEAVDNKDDERKLKQVLNDNYYKINPKNPFGNVLLTEINDTPNRKAAQPAFNSVVNDRIMGAVKQEIQELNPTIINTNKQLFGGLWENYQLNQSMQRFYSTANTRVANDQTAFAKYLYGDMPSGKSFGADGALARVRDNERYILM
jgi:hypothetical protein